MLQNTLNNDYCIKIALSEASFGDIYTLRDCGGLRRGKSFFHRLYTI